MGAAALSVFRALFIAQLASNIGTLMQSVGSAWLMGDLGASAFLIALVPTASMLPVLLVGVPGGALADIFDRRRLLIGGQVWMLLCAAGLAAMSFLDVVTPFSLLALTFGLGLGSALTFPAFQAIQPELVPPREFRQAIALGSMTFNVGRAIGPAIGGFVVAIAGPGWVFLINAISFLAIVGVLLWWRRPITEDTMPDETLSGAVRAGLRYAAHSPGLRGVLNRTAIFIIPAAALQALLPVVVRDRLGLGSGGYGILLGCFGIGAASAAVIRPAARRTIRPRPARLRFFGRDGKFARCGRVQPDAVGVGSGDVLRRPGMGYRTQQYGCVVVRRAAGVGARPRAGSLPAGVGRGPRTRERCMGCARRGQLDRRVSRGGRNPPARLDDDAEVDARIGVGPRPSPRPDRRPQHHHRSAPHRRPGTRRRRSTKCRPTKYPPLPRRCG